MEDNTIMTMPPQRRGSMWEVVLLPSTVIEIIHPRQPIHIQAVLFDYDGTLSLVRSGWRAFAIRFIVDTLAALTPAAERDQLHSLAIERVDALTGHPTATLMTWLGTEVVRRGGQPAAPEEYVTRAYAPLWDVVEQRLAQVQRGELHRDALLVPGARTLLEQLYRSGLSLWLLSGSRHDYLVRETAILGIAHYFGEHIYGPLVGGSAFTKRAVMEQLLRDAGVAGTALLTFGDGPVETTEARALGAFVVGVAYDEECGGGLDGRKRAELIRDGAQLVIPDYRDADALLTYLFSVPAR
jgi:phosphoglycolate phosphatase